MTRHIGNIGPLNPPDHLPSYKIVGPLDRAVLSVLTERQLSPGERMLDSLSSLFFGSRRQDFVDLEELEARDRFAKK